MTNSPPCPIYRKWTIIIHLVVNSRLVLVMQWNSLNIMRNLSIFIYVIWTENEDVSLQDSASNFQDEIGKLEMVLKSKISWTVNYENSLGKDSLILGWLAQPNNNKISKNQSVIHILEIKTKNKKLYHIEKSWILRYRWELPCDIMKSF